MNIKIIDELQQLNSIFIKNKTPLFVVGGFVRDSLLQLNPTDIDLASSVKNQELFELLKNTQFTVQLGSKKLGTCIIKTNSISFEHTTFRQETYKKGGFHTPDQVVFINDIKEDAKRRDFTINSLYYDIENKKIIDIFGGLDELKEKKVKAIVSPNFVFKSDGLRILRMIRIASELAFDIDENTYNTAKKMIHQLNDISKDRLYKEFELILLSNKKYGNCNTKALEQLFELGALPHIFKSLQQFENTVSFKKLKENLYYYLLPNNNYPLDTFYLDLALFLSKITLLKPSVVLSKTLNLNTCGISKKERQNVINYVKAYEQIKKCKNDFTIRKFIQDHQPVLNILFFVLNNNKDINSYEILKRNYNYMIEHKMPFNLKQLAVNGVIIQEELKLENKKQIGTLLNKALKFCMLEKNNNTKAKIIKFLKKEQKKEK